MSPRIAGNQPNPERSPTDLYPTDPRWTRALLRLGFVRFEQVWEPAAGNGDLSEVLREEGFDVLETDILTGTDFLTQETPWRGAVVTNPPYSLADEFVAKALELADGPVALLLPVGALGGQGKYQRIWSANPPGAVVVCVGRMVVLGKPSQFGHVWAVWPARSQRPVHPSAVRLLWEVP